MGSCFLILRHLHPTDAEKTCILGLEMPAPTVGAQWWPWSPQDHMGCGRKVVHVPWVVWWMGPRSVGAYLLQSPSVLEGDPTPSLRLLTGTPAQRSSPAGAWSFVSQTDPQKLKTHGEHLPQCRWVVTLITKVPVSQVPAKFLLMFCKCFPFLHYLLNYLVLLKYFI